MQGHEWLFIIAVQRAPVGGGLLGESSQRCGWNRLLVDEGERLWWKGRRLQELRRVRHDMQEGQPAAYRGHALGEQWRQLQGLVRTFARDHAHWGDGPGSVTRYLFIRCCLAHCDGSVSADPSPRI